ncbi:hypothetical protein E3N88_39919 [Mikania micrantha]|uniref:Uncharacterized protein n=1 Tax=Mikania micrantha TaxID=192012 RepID=A0A5N6LL63_9ASTR|nr:hypothetical protein E3N88_39919 [Mikania micrantha]
MTGQPRAGLHPESYSHEERWEWEMQKGKWIHQRQSDRVKATVGLIASSLRDVLGLRATEMSWARDCSKLWQLARGSRPPWGSPTKLGDVKARPTAMWRGPKLVRRIVLNCGGNGRRGITHPMSRLTLLFQLYPGAIHLQEGEHIC